MSPVLVGAAAGLLGGLGLCLVLWHLTTRRVGLVERVAPYLTERPPTSRLLAEAPGPAPVVLAEKLLGPVLADVGRLLERLGSTSASIRRRLVLVGSSATVEHFRLEQLAWAAVGLAVGLLVAILATLRGASLVAMLVLVAICVLAGAIARDQLLTHQVGTRRARLAAELPDVAELLALAVAAGEGLLAALSRVAEISDGELTVELRRTLAEARSGVPLAVALERMAARTDAPAVARFADSVAVAVERGAPLAEVLRAQAQDARDSARRDLMELGGKKEVSMMIPVVFILLPLTVLFALFPGIATLDVGL